MTNSIKTRLAALESASINGAALLPIVGTQEPNETEADALLRLQKENPNRRVILLARFVDECV